MNEMKRKELFKKYNIDESHNVWENIVDNWMSVEIYRIMHNGQLPTGDELSINWVTEFLDKTNDMKFMSELMKRDDWGSLYLTAKRMVYKFADQFERQKATMKDLTDDDEANEQGKLYPCPYDSACKCNLKDCCLECEKFGEYLNTSQKAQPNEDENEDKIIIGEPDDLSFLKKPTDEEIRRWAYDESVININGDFERGMARGKLLGAIAMRDNKITEK